MAKYILVAEDEFLIAMDVEMILRRHGWLVLGPVGTVVQALRLLETERPAVALLDVTLKDGPVSPVAEALRAMSVPFVLASAYDEPELVGGEALAGVSNVGKPIEERRLLAALRHATQP